jgi:prepilin peptidase CpaA
VEKYFLVTALIIATIGAAQDLRIRRIPNWLTYSGLLAALVIRTVLSGWSGAKSVFAGTAVASGVFLVLYLLKAMGGGDVKLMAAVGAWAGPSHALVILVAVSIAGGVLALLYMIFGKLVVKTLRNTLALFRHHLTSGFRAHAVLNIEQPASTRLPYGVAIAVGTLYCAASVLWWR